MWTRGFRVGDSGGFVRVVSFFLFVEGSRKFIRWEMGVYEYREGIDDSFVGLC